MPKAIAFNLVQLSVAYPTLHLYCGFIALLATCIVDQQTIVSTKYSN